ncbi:MAG TPA: hypothetical protein DIV82_03735 [Brevundimonas diminuta]|nr:hypothetical protein [Brevundimonas diminuta]
MTLHALVAALGGDLYGGGLRASVPAPGHSDADRSVSLLLSGDRLIVHCFGSACWTAVRDDLRALGHIDREGRLISGGRSAGDRAPDPRPDRQVRLRTARWLWDDSRPIGPGSLASRYLARRAISFDRIGASGLRHHPRAPLSVYRSGGATRPALVAAITSPVGELTAVEVTYLAANGDRDARVRTSRKMVGLFPPGSAVRLASDAEVMVVGEGVMSVLSASAHTGLPAWALLSARNLSLWSPPGRTRRVVVAADRGPPGEAAADILLNRLRSLGVDGALALPPGDAEDWNAWAMHQRKKEGG